MDEKSRRFAAPWVRAVAPVLPIAVFGAVWIVLHATAGRGGTHTLFQVLALAEGTIALLLRGRKPVGALAGILVVYALADLDAIMTLPVLLAVATVADRHAAPPCRGRRGGEPGRLGARTSPSCDPGRRDGPGDRDGLSRASP